MNPWINWWGILSLGIILGFLFPGFILWLITLGIIFYISYTIYHSNIEYSEERIFMIFLIFEKILFIAGMWLGRWVTTAFPLPSPAHRIETFIGSLFISLGKFLVG